MLVGSPLVGPPNAVVCGDADADVDVADSGDNDGAGAGTVGCGGSDSDDVVVVGDSAIGGSSVSLSDDSVGAEDTAGDGRDLCAVLGDGGSNPGGCLEGGEPILGGGFWGRLGRAFGCCCGCWGCCLAGMSGGGCEGTCFWDLALTVAASCGGTGGGRDGGGWGAGPLGGGPGIPLMWAGLGGRGGGTSGCDGRLMAVDEERRERWVYTKKKGKEIKKKERAKRTFEDVCPLF